MVSNWSLWVLIGPMFVLMDNNGSLWVVMRPYAFSQILMGPYESPRVFLSCYGSL